MESNKDLLYDILGKEHASKYDVDDTKKKWKELLKRFKQEQTKASFKPPQAGTADIILYKLSWGLYESLKYVNVIICNDTDESVSSIAGSWIPRVKKVSKQQERDGSEDKQVALFSEAVLALKEPEASKNKNVSV